MSRKDFLQKADIIAIDTVIHFGTPPHRIVLHASPTAKAIAVLTRSSARATMIVIIIIVLHVDSIAYSTVSRGSGVDDDDCAGLDLYFHSVTPRRKDENINPVYFIGFKAASNERPIELSFVNNRS